LKKAVECKESLSIWKLGAIFCPLIRNPRDSTKENDFEFYVSDEKDFPARSEVRPLPLCAFKGFFNVESRSIFIGT
jgi:hypothetical protein